MKLDRISEDDALRNHGIRTFHTINAASGELRFRLLKDPDGTSYIRTEAPPEGAWQESHEHSKVMETYIVQKGWIGYAEDAPSGPRFLKFTEGESFTTPPNLVHNVYLPKGSVIHTVKHGDGLEEIRSETDRAKRFTALCESFSEHDFLVVARSPCSSAAPSGVVADEYSDGYRHFDNLIWQVPTVSSALFTLVLLATQSISAEPAAAILNVDPKALLTLIYSVCGTFICIISYALYRFRFHQAKIKPWPAKFLVSPQTGLQLFVTLQGLILILLAVNIWKVPFEWLVVGIVVGLAAPVFFEERHLYRENLKLNKQVRTQS